MKETLPACVTCAAGKTSTIVGATDATVCVLDACPAGTYANAGACVNCLAGKYLGETGATSSAACTSCVAGTYSTTAGATVVGTCILCPTNSNSPSSSSAVAACTCKVGYTWINGETSGPCTACTIGKYKSTTGGALCTPCATNSNSPSASSADTACTCNAGYTGADGGPCSACAAGQYKTSSGSVACTDCAAGTFSATAGTSTCPACATGGVSAAGSTACQFDCAAGSTGLPGVCALCVAGKYKTSAGSAACAGCGAGTYSLTVGATADATCVACLADSYSPTQTTCLACPSNASAPSSSSSSAACLCNAGFTGANGGTCSACVAGKYKGVSGSANCSDCGVGTYSVTVGATAAATCVACLANSYSPTQTTCLACPSNANAPSSSSSSAACLCNAGFTGANGGTCSACVAGTYKASAGSAACVDCGAGTSSPAVGATAAATCVGCPANSYTVAVGASACSSCAANYNSPSQSTAVTACTCNAGYTGGDGHIHQSYAHDHTSCSPCDAGKYKTISGSAACSDCGAGTYSSTVGATAAATCVTCLTNSYSPTQSSAKEACVCNVGYTGPGGSSTLTYFAGGTFTDLTSSCGVNMNQKCTCQSSVIGFFTQYGRTCEKAFDDDLRDGYQFQAMANVCPSQPPAWTGLNCYWGISSTLEQPYIMINFGQSVDVTSVKILSSNTEYDWRPKNFDIFIGDSTTMTNNAACATNQSFVNVQPLGQSGYKTFGCVGRGQYLFIRQGLFSGNYLQITEMEVPGSIPEKNNPCAACLAGTFKPTIGSAVCTNCAADTYSTVTGRNSSCVPCQANAVSASGSASQAFCYCKSGYAHTAGMSTCRICDPGTWNSQLGRTACSNCSVGLYSVNYGAIGSETCLTCPLGQWSPEGSPNCNLCPANSRAAAGSGLITNCICDAGYTGASGSTCAACGAATYKSATGSAACSACPALTSSSGAARNVSDCWCVTGYIKIEGACVAMAPGAVVVDGSLAGVSASSSEADIEAATQALRASIALQLNIPIELVQITRVANSIDGVRVSIFGRSAAELSAIESASRLAATVPTVSRLPFTLSTSAYTNTSVLAGARAVVVDCRLLNLSATAHRRVLLQASSDGGSVVGDALAVLRLELRQQFNVALAAVRVSFDDISADNTLRLTVTIDAASEQELQAVRGVAAVLLAQGSLVLANSMVLLLYSSRDAGPCGLNFSSTLVRADAAPMTLEEAQAAWPVLQAQLSLYYGVPASAVEVRLVVVDGAYSVQTVVRAAYPATLESLQQGFVQAPPALDVAVVTRELPFQMTNMDVSYGSVPAVAGVSLPNAVVIQCELAYADGTPLSSSEAAEASTTLVLQLAAFLHVDASLVQVELVPARNPAASSASSVRVVVLCAADAVDDVFQRAQLMPATAVVRLVPVAFAGLSGAVVSAVQGQMVAGQLVECPANYRVYNATCQCAPGYMLLPDSTCAACAAGKYSAGIGASACAYCPADTYAANASTACKACPANAVSSTGSAAVDACSCNPGYFFFLTLLERRTCVPCAVGSFKSAVGNNNCTACWTGSSLSVGGTTEEACCPANSTFSRTCSELGPNLARLCGTSGNEACVTSSRSQWRSYGAQYANDGVTTQSTPFISNCCGGREEWWQVDLSRQRTINTVVIYRQGDRPETLTDFKIQLSNNGINFVDCATGQESAAAEPFQSTHMCAGFAQFLRVSMFPPGGELNQYLFLQEVEVYSGMPPGTCSSGCLCNSGYTSPTDGPCGACAVGKYKNTTSKDTCGECAAGSFAAANASLACALCPVNTFSDAAGVARCTACPNLTQSAGGSNASSACQCVAGYTGAGGLEVCAKCGAGTFKSVAGSAACSSCPARTFSSALGASSSATCTACHPNATSAAGSPSKEYCYCEAGFAQVNGTTWCALCNPGKYNTQLAGTACSNCTVGLYAAGYGSKGVDSCFACPAGQWSPEGSPDCKMCPVNSAAPARSGLVTNCLCNPGFTGANGDSCVACVAGTYKAANGSAACTSCVAGQYQPQLAAISASSCTTCAADTFSNTSASVCTGCPAGFKALPGTTTVQDCCGLNSTPQNIIECAAPKNLAMSCGGTGIQGCPVTSSPYWIYSGTSYIPERANDGLFVDGYVSESGGREGPPPTFWRVDFQRQFVITSVKIWAHGLPYGNPIYLANFALQLSNDSVSFVNCATGQYANTTAPYVSTHTCNGTGQYLRVALPSGYLGLNEVQVYGVPDVCWSTRLCPCNAGYTGPDSGASKGNCSVCPAGTYKAANGSAACVSCTFGSNSSSGQSACTCTERFYANGSACFPKYATLQGVFQCNVGYTGPNGTGPCVECAAGTYKNVLGSAACTSCPAGQNQSALAATSCATCAADTFSSIGASACTACPAGFKALSGTTTSADCCGLNSSPTKFTTPDLLSSILATSPAYLMASAEGWDAVNLRFTDLTGNGRHGALTAGNVSVGSVTGNGAGRSVPYAEGTTATKILWPATSIPPIFTVCSISRYTGGTSARVLACTAATWNWMHGHWGGYAGTTYYDISYWNDRTLFYTISPNTNWVVACGRNTGTAGASSTIVNGLVTSTAGGGTGNCQLNLNNDDPSNWQLSKLYIWNRHLSNTEFAEASAKLNSYLAVVSNQQDYVPCSCNTGYTGPETGASKGQCTICPTATYKSTNGSANCTSCAVNANSSVGSTNVSACSCNPGYTGPDVGPCVACAAGTAKSVSGSAACGVCAADTFSNTNIGAFSCTACPAGFKALPGTTTVQDCCKNNSSPTCLTVRNVIAPYSTTACARFIALTPKPSFASISTRINAAVGTMPTYNAAGGPNGKGHVSFDRTNSQYLDAGSRTFNIATNGGVTIVAVVRYTQSTGYYEEIVDIGNGNSNNNFFIAREANTANFHIEFYNGGSVQCRLNPIGVIVQNSWLTLVVSYRSSDKMCSVTVNGVVSNVIASSPLTDRTVSYSWMGRGIGMQAWGGAYLNADLAGVFVVDEYLGTSATTAISDAMIEGVDLTSMTCNETKQICSLCSCNAGYTGPDTGASKGQCTTCPPGTYKSTNGSAACSLCPANTLSTAVQATANSTCLACPSNSVSAAGSTGCVCNFGYTGEAVSCSACAAGTFKGVLGTSACMTCPANTETVGTAPTLCSSKVGFSGLGYALDDVARSCGSALNETCKTLSNGATTNAVGAVDGALDGSASTFVSVAFNPNLARACGKTGTDACVASHAPVSYGGSGLAIDGNTNTEVQSSFGTSPYWGVDFGRSRTVFVVKLLSSPSSDQWWRYLKDFKIVVGNVSDAKSPLNAVCADYLTGSGTSYVTFACEDSVRGRYLFIVNGPHEMNYLTLSEVVVEAFNYAANPSLMQPWWAVDFEVERAVTGVVIQTQASSAVQVRVGHSTDPLQNAVCGSSTMLVGVNNTVTCVTAMAGRYLFVIGPGNSVLVLNEVRVIGIAAAQCAAGTYKPLVGNTNCTACPAFSTSVVGATSFSQCSCSAPYF